ncbi:hypothetical protein CNMCM5793_000927 [Aspergillus hiratsukae]|uniref:Uncharacterized protein n=1 Tax=Aspergillus hiratsukae TaxID=1194566 RepID=A0A8H6UQW7_9EURO|nr:hypothetical protein CNMCM5793_000927 [Aspergillus hiratsukae]KAF7163452.1 hypothetical protein CNMCM6106_000402 [Aspergillus hiratsukae]
MSRHYTLFLTRYEPPGFNRRILERLSEAYPIVHIAVLVHMPIPPPQVHNPLLDGIGSNEDYTPEQRVHMAAATREEDRMYQHLYQKAMRANPHPSLPWQNGQQKTRRVLGRGHER